MVKKKKNQITSINAMNRLRLINDKLHAKKVPLHVLKLLKFVNMLLKSQESNTINGGGFMDWLLNPIGSLLGSVFGDSVKKGYDDVASLPTQIIQEVPFAGKVLKYVAPEADLAIALAPLGKYMYGTNTNQWLTNALGDYNQDPGYTVDEKTGLTLGELQPYIDWLNSGKQGKNPLDLINNISSNLEDEYEQLPETLTPYEPYSVPNINQSFYNSSGEFIETPPALQFPSVYPDLRDKAQSLSNYLLFCQKDTSSLIKGEYDSIVNIGQPNIWMSFPNNDNIEGGGEKWDKFKKYAIPIGTAALAIGAAYAGHKHYKGRNPSEFIPSSSTTSSSTSSSPSSLLREEIPTDPQERFKFMNIKKDEFLANRELEYQAKRRMQEQASAQASALALKAVKQADAKKAYDSATLRASNSIPVSNAADEGDRLRAKNALPIPKSGVQQIQQVPEQLGVAPPPRSRGRPKGIPQIQQVQEQLTPPRSRGRPKGSFKKNNNDITGDGHMDYLPLALQSILFGDQVYDTIKTYRDENASKGRKAIKTINTVLKGMNLNKNYDTFKKKSISRKLK
jgi:hypothetical protein